MRKTMGSLPLYVLEIMQRSRKFARIEGSGPRQAEMSIACL